MLLDPSQLVKHKENVAQKLHLYLTQQNKNDMDLFGNPRYTPENRILFLKKLSMCEKFVQSIGAMLRCGGKQRLKKYVRLRKLIMELYHNFKEFEDKWFLMKYSHLKNDINKRKELHGDFRIVIQSLFGFFPWFADRSMHDGKFHGIIDNKIAANVNKQVTLSTNHELIILRPQNQSEVDALFDVIRQDWAKNGAKDLY